MELFLQHRIRERAYEIWNRTGRVHGQADQHWLAAEREILSECSGQIAAPAAAMPDKPASVRKRRAVTSTRSQPKKIAKAS